MRMQEKNITSNRLRKMLNVENKSYYIKKVCYGNDYL